MLHNLIRSPHMLLWILIFYFSVFWQLLPTYGMSENIQVLSYLTLIFCWHITHMYHQLIL
jgi:hypothetical protein